MITKMTEENKKISLARKIAVYAATLGGLVGIVGLNESCAYVLPLGKNPERAQWMNIDGKMGFINCQGYGLVPAGDDGFYVYQLINGNWVNINNIVEGVSDGGDGFLMEHSEYSREVRIRSNK